MARLIPQGQGGLTEPFELRLGLNRIGRHPKNDVHIDHGTVSLFHCEVSMDGDALSVHDLRSTNGTFVDGARVEDSRMAAGQRLRLGSVEFAIEFAEVRVVIPEYQQPVVPPLLKTATGKSVCIRHDNRQAVWKCERCTHLLCTPCIHRMRRRGGKTLYLCPDCSGTCELLPEFVVQKKASWFGSLREKLKVTSLIGGRKKKK